MCACRSYTRQATGKGVDHFDHAKEVYKSAIVFIKREGLVPVVVKATAVGRRRSHRRLARTFDVLSDCEVIMTTDKSPEEFKQ